MKRTQHAVEFRQDAVDLALSGEKSQAQTARDLGVTEKRTIRPTCPLPRPRRIAPDLRSTCAVPTQYLRRSPAAGIA